MSWRKAVINNAFYVFPPTGVKTFPQVELNRVNLTQTCTMHVGKMCIL